MDLTSPRRAPSPAALRVDASGDVRVVEHGTADDVPAELRRLAAGALRAAVGELRAVHLDGAPVAALVRAEETTALVSVDPLEALPHGLSRRELEVLTLLVAGLTNAGIAARLEIGARTVGTHVDRVLAKLDVASRGAAAARALDEGLVVVPPPGGAAGFEQMRLGKALAAADEAPARRVPSPRLLRRRPLRVGALLPHTGAATADAREMEQGARLAIEELNAAGGVAGRLLELRIADVDPQDAATVRAGFAGLLAADVDVLTSGYLAPQDLAHHLAAEAGVPYLHAATSGLMERLAAGEPGRFARVFQVCPSDVHYGPHFVDYVSDLRDRGAWRPGSRRLLAVRPTWELVDLGLEKAAEQADRRGWELVVATPAADGWSGAGARAAAGEPAAVMVGSYLVDDHVAFVEGFRASRGSGLLYGIYAPSVPELRARLGPLADGVLWATTTGTYPDRLGRAFAARYARRFGAVPGRSHAGIAYDRVHLVAGAWAVADFRDFTAVADHLRRSVHRGVNGAYAFDGPGQTAQTWTGEGTGDPSLAQAHLVHQIQDGRQRVVSPATYADGDFVLPPWAG
ncbi:ABC transporter substrate-binding protein [Actinomycetospora sp. TBRC 11914]|uniref:ABC transporter substrate-binding protein n=1 Tax=Actinomycetospora sp. TBRC 11914 TaxID=2729387 RepID=UPI00145D2135|nr:ABC transporter substrate-binding protein [Actinomycetospora sp. TBRC 11914]NMO88397.1 ABC transporter substrate-binding protein [Actinomycetospora sp. TBRC 11914]